MSTGSQFQQDALLAWLAVNDGVATEAQKQLVSQLIESDPQTRALFIALAEQQAWLKWRGAPIVPGQNVAPSVGHGLTIVPEENCTTPGTCSSVPFTDAEDRPPLMSFLHDLFFLRTATISRAAAMYLLVSVAGIGALLGALAVAATPQLPVGGHFPRIDSTAIVGLMTEVAGSRWRNSTEFDSDRDTLLAGQELELLSGSAQSTFRCGATVVANGPTRFTPKSKWTVKLQAGKLMVTTPRTAHGFAVQTPQFRVSDVETPFGIRTVFGVHVAGDVVSVHAFQGEVMVSFPAPEGVDNPPAPLQLKMGQGLRLAANHLTVEKIASDATVFMPPAAQGESDLKIPERYVEAVKNSRPLAYWRFESMRDGAFIENEMPAPWPLRLCGDVHLESDHGNGLAVFPPTDRECWLQTDEPISAFAANYSLELWFKANGYEESTLVSIGPSPVREDGIGISGAIELIGADHLKFLPGSIRFLHRNPPGIYGGSNAFSSQPYIPRQWHHVVATKSDAEISLYVDGKLTGVESEPTRLTVDPRIVIGRLHLEANPTSLNLRETRQFCGQIDEIAIYNRALKTHEVEMHFRYGESQSTSSRRHDRGNPSR